MKYPDKTEFAVLDFETNGLEMYQEDKKVVSMALSKIIEGKLKSWYYDTEDSIRQALEGLAKNKTPVMVYNAQFEMLVMMTQFPDIKLNIVGDALRLVQQEFTPKDMTFGLKPATAKLLPPQFSNYEKEIKDWIIGNIQIPSTNKDGKVTYKRPNDKNWGEFISQAPRDILARYNQGDTENTLRIWATIQHSWKNEGFLPQYEPQSAYDHERYIKRARRFSKAKITGFLVDREFLAKGTKNTQAELDSIEEKFFAQHKDDIETVLDRRWDAELLKKRESVKTEAAKKRHTREGSPDSRPTFNIGSTQQLKMLFVDVQNQLVKIKTPTGAPSFNSKHLGQFKGTEHLINRGNFNLALKQMQRLEELSRHDGIYHMDIKAAGTVTGRTAGAGGLNLQAIHRGYEPLTGAIKARPGHVFVGSDIESAEPSITAQFSKDPLVRYFAFEGEGKKPFYKDGIFFCDDPYVSLAAMTPMGREAIKKVFDEGFEGQGLGDFWINNSEPGKKLFKKVRKMHKPWYLGLGYGMGPRMLREKSAEAGIDISFAEAKEIWQAYWNMLPLVRLFADKCAEIVEKQGYIHNVFGFHMRPEPHNAFNAIIQSSVNTVMDLFEEGLEARGWDDQFRVRIHDETIFEVRIDQLQEFKNAMEDAQKEVNRTLQWEVPMRFGFVVGTTLYEAKDGLPDEKLKELGIELT